jgi:hypothetical protein
MVMALVLDEKATSYRISKGMAMLDNESKKVDS